MISKLIYTTSNDEHGTHCVNSSFSCLARIRLSSSFILFYLHYQAMSSLCLFLFLDLVWRWSDIHPPSFILHGSLHYNTMSLFNNSESYLLIFSSLPYQAFTSLFDNPRSFVVLCGMIWCVVWLVLSGFVVSGTRGAQEDVGTRDLWGRAHQWDEMPHMRKRIHSFSLMLKHTHTLSLSLSHTQSLTL